MGVISLYRSPLVKGEGLYHLQNWHNGKDEKGVARPRVTASPLVLPDGRLRWEIPDFPENRKVIALSYSGKGPAAGSTYTAEYPAAAETAPDAPAEAHGAPTARTRADVAAELAAAVGAPGAAHPAKGGHHQAAHKPKGGHKPRGGG